jgi:nitrate reductase NapD
MTDDLIQTVCTEPVLHIAGVVVQARPDVLPHIKKWLRVFPGAETQMEDSRGKLVVVLEAETEQKILDLLDGLNAQAGVFNAALVYHEILPGHEMLTGHENPTGELQIL